MAIETGERLKICENRLSCLGVLKRAIGLAFLTGIKAREAAMGDSRTVTPESDLLENGGWRVLDTSVIRTRRRL